ncbi:MAG: ATPase [Clostridia bacterium]|nr:ATPase [Clostridia bacterium]
MKQLLILSGKGGTGKTTVAGAFIRLANARVFADCDVDAPNLHLIMNWSQEPERDYYYGLPKARIDPEKCIRCGLCLEKCRFEAITHNGVIYKADDFACEGCGVCAMVCPAEAITMKPAPSGELMLHTGNETVFSTARLKMGSGNSGMLVTEVKTRMKDAAKDEKFAIIDGSPGIGCPVIASLSGVNLALIVAEPSVSGISDMERIIKTAGIFGTMVAVCVNKYDANPENTAKIEAFCKEKDLPFVGKIPFDPEAVKAINNGKTIADVDCPSGRAAKDVFQKTMALLFEEKNGGVT